jgi:hypothetical protein
MKLNKKLTRTSILFCLLVVYSCAGPRMGGQSSGKRHVEVFFVGDFGMQYFVRPLFFKHESGTELMIDFTFRVKDIPEDSARVNLSVISINEPWSYNLFFIELMEKQVPIERITRMFTERKPKDRVHSRYTGYCALKPLLSLFNNGNWVIKSGTDGIIKFEPQGKTVKTIEAINHHYVSLFPG